MRAVTLLSLPAALVITLGLAACAQGTVSNPGYCGDGLVQSELGEQCDDGNPFGGDGCSAHCISEAGAEINCQNGVDDDNDGLIDCADPGCQLSPVCSGVRETLCANGLDDDQDGLADCADPDCALDPTCQGGAEVVCDNGQDDDNDGQIDCLDADCAGRACGPNGRVCVGTACQCGTGQTEEVLCTDGVDDDCDGLTDCADPDCQASPACVNTESLCANGLDDDNDGLTDCADPDCLNQPCGANGRQCSAGACNCPGGTTESSCTDGQDNDCDGLTDCADSDCAGSPSCVSTETSCIDGVDNDGDGFLDCADSDCANLPCGANGRQCLGGQCACPGGTTEVCGDGVDNNCDGQADEGCSAGTCSDPLYPAADCGAGAHCMPTPTVGVPGQCLSPTGLGTHYDYCNTHEDCGPPYVCVDVGDILPLCLQWCTSWTQCPYSSFENCNPISPPQYVNNQEWGFCY